MGEIFSLIVLYFLSNFRLNKIFSFCWDKNILSPLFSSCDVYLTTVFKYHKQLNENCMTRGSVKRHDKHYRNSVPRARHVVFRKRVWLFLTQVIVSVIEAAMTGKLDEISDVVEVCLLRLVTFDFRGCRFSLY